MNESRPSVSRAATTGSGSGEQLAPLIDPSIHSGPWVILQSAPAGTLRVRLLGAFTVWRSGEEIPADAWSRRKVAALCKCLLSASHQRLHREQLIDALWPEADPQAGANNLRFTLHQLRRVLDGGSHARRLSHLQSAGDMVILTPAPAGDPDPDWLDIVAFGRRATAALNGHDLAICRAALHWYSGEYLPEDRYEEWAVAPRDAVRRQYLSLLAHGTELCLAEGQEEEALRWCQLALVADPCNETAARRLMQLLVSAGHPAGAVRVYQNLTRALEEELGLVPSRETEAVRAGIRVYRPAGSFPVAPPAPPVVSVPGNLPVERSSFVGRSWEQAEVASMLSDAGCRLVTLSGPGGVGKSRLALVVAAALRQSPASPYAGGIWLVPLDVLPENSDPDPLPVLRAVAAVLGVQEKPAHPVLDTLQEVLSARRVLLLLDNCEHLVAACAAALDQLLAGSALLQVLATSREHLRVAGEQVWHVPPLTLPAQQMEASVEALLQYESVQLFCERARAAQRHFVLEPHTAPAIIQICRRLDGLPLAIELAAARVPSLTVIQIAARLDHCFEVLSGGQRTAPSRQQTLKATLDWSYGLLAPPEQALFCRLAVFSGDWSLEAVETVCAGDVQPRSNLLDLLGDLAAKSLVQMLDSADAARYSLLETVRQYAWERLVERGEHLPMRDRHLGWCLELAERADAALLGQGLDGALARLEAEHDNLRAALRWSLIEGQRWSAGVALTGALWKFWSMRGHGSEGRVWFAAALAHGACASAAYHARMLVGAGALAQEQGDYALAHNRYTESLSLYRDAKDNRGIATALTSLGVVAWYQSDHQRAATLYEESLTLRRALGDIWGIASTLNNLGMVAKAQGDRAQARLLYEQCLALYQDLGNKRGAASALNNLGGLAQEQGNYSEAHGLFERSLAIMQALGNTRGIALALLNLGIVALGEQEHERAAALLDESLALYSRAEDRQGIATVHMFRGLVHLAQGACTQAANLIGQGLRIFQTLGSTWGVGLCFEAQATVFGAARRSWQAAQLFGAAETLRAVMGTPLPPGEHARHQRSLEEYRTVLGEAAFAAAWDEGQELSLEHAIAIALQTVN